MEVGDTADYKTVGVFFSVRIAKKVYTREVGSVKAWIVSSSLAKLRTVLHYSETAFVTSIEMCRNISLKLKRAYSARQHNFLPISSCSINLLFQRQRRSVKGKFNTRAFQRPRFWPSSMHLMIEILV